MSIQGFLVEFDDHAAGIAVRVPGGFIFYASDDDFAEMDGRIFPRARQIERHVKKLSRLQPRQHASLHARAIAL